MILSYGSLDRLLQLHSLRYVRTCVELGTRVKFYGTVKRQLSFQWQSNLRLFSPSEQDLRFQFSLSTKIQT
jgi:hypothetical protein